MAQGDDFIAYRTPRYLRLYPDWRIGSDRPASRSNKGLRGQWEVSSFFLDLLSVPPPWWRTKRAPITAGAGVCGGSKRTPHHGSRPRPGSICLTWRSGDTQVALLVRPRGNDRRYRVGTFCFTPFASARSSSSSSPSWTKTGVPIVSGAKLEAS